MYFINKTEFTYALYFTYFSTYSENVKNNLLKNIYTEYLQYNTHCEDFETIYEELTSGNFLPNIDYDFLIKHNGKIFDINTLLKFNIKIHHLEKSEFVSKIVTLKNNHCLQCGETNIFAYSSDFKNDVKYCKSCIDFGISNNSHYKFFINYNFEKDYKRLQFPNITLSNEQQIVSNSLVNDTRKNSSSLVWAVCGAGKTEIIYNLIYKNLKNGKNICIAIPRKDVVREIYVRLKKDFNIDINVLHGDEKVLTNNKLYIMTTHQLVKYYNFFDIIVVDEVDAFPYDGNSVLQHSSKKALKKESILIFLSATPSKKIIKSVENIYKIPIRYHQYLLPVPKIKILKTVDYKCKTTIKELEKFIINVKETKRRALIFVPSIETCKKLTKILQQKFSKIDGVSSIDDKRNIKIQKMYSKEIDILVTTTILERGVTFDYLDVLIFEANHQHFSKSALIQISGRVGRKEYSPNGEIIFLAEEKNKNMKNAIKEIKKMNELAKYRKLNKKYEM